MVCLSLHRDTGGGNGGGGVVLGGENVAGSPGDLSTEGNEGLNEDSSLDGYRMGQIKLVRGHYQRNILMCRQPAMRAPWRGWSAPYFSRMAMRPGISTSESSISRRPKAARD
jgi:hypothetical protein